MQSQLVHCPRNLMSWGLSVLLGLGAIASAPSLAATPLEESPLALDSAPELAQVTAVSQLLDVQPTDWSFQALQSLVERHHCIVGYPSQQYLGDRALSRYEFAAALQSCLTQITTEIAKSQETFAAKEDLATLEKLQQDFAAELTTLRDRVDQLESHTAILGNQSFSTTTKLVGEIIMALTQEFNQSTANQAVLQHRVRLDLQTSFTGKDVLHTRLATGNANVFAIAGGGAEGIQTFNFGNSITPQIYADWLAYYLPLGDQTQLVIEPTGGGHIDYTPTNSNYLESFDGGTGALSVFAERNPIYQIGGGTGLGIVHKLNPSWMLSLGYYADNTDPTLAATGALLFAANNPSQGGFFGGENSFMTQVTWTPNEAFSLGATYVRAYRKFSIFDGGSSLPATGTTLANGFGLGESIVNGYGLSATYRISPRVTVNGWLSYVNADFLSSGLGSGDIWTYALTLGFPDLGGAGNLGGFVVGVEPYLANAGQLVAGAKNNLPIHLEAFYRYSLSDHLSITPGLIWIIAPDQNANNRDAIIATLRTTFLF